MVVLPQVGGTEGQVPRLTGWDGGTGSSSHLGLFQLNKLVNAVVMSYCHYHDIVEGAMLHV
ncbi:hypothetical protein N782_00670 [Pontibacillus yanchengensis Y32]|uniref:Uncharacterized protein n=1 Tax=Pontibacillus yanchengensis Y32 TaxID=1385514 RepID=A0A0A2TKV4_9BACI|nr:hypothetical protein N782_00670 [Pontibacillus yanchengensis Y32]